MHCREFRSKHVGFVDDLLSAADMADMRRHIGVCPRCSTLDTRIRRSLLVARNLPQIEPSADFFARLSEQLKCAPVESVPYRSVSTAALVVITTALAAAVYFAMAVTVHRSPADQPVQNETAAVISDRSIEPGDPAMVATVPAGVPVWPAMFMVGELPMHLANAELLDNGIGR